MKRKPAKPQPAVTPGRAQGKGSGAPVKAPRPAAKPQPSPRPAGVITTPVQRGPAPAKKPAAKKKPVKRKLALGESIACCAAEALAASLRLAGAPVSDEDVLALYWHTADDADAGASVWATLEAAYEFGLAGIRPLSFREVVPSEPGYWPSLGHKTRAGLILGGDLPGPHALYDDGAAWWSWGQPWDPADFPLAVIEEAWQVTW